MKRILYIHASLFTKTLYTTCHGLYLSIYISPLCTMDRTCTGKCTAIWNYSSIFSFYNVQPLCQFSKTIHFQNGSLINKSITKENIHKPINIIFKVIIFNCCITLLLKNGVFASSLHHRY